MNAILGLLTSKLAGPIAAGVAVLLGIFLAYTMVSDGTKIGDRDDTIRAQTAQIGGLQRDLATSRANAATLEASLERQNAAIQAQAADAAARLARLDQVASQARADATEAQRRAAAILARPRTGNACADADAAILEAVR